MQVLRLVGAGYDPAADPLLGLDRVPGRAHVPEDVECLLAVLGVDEVRPEHVRPVFAHVLDRDAGRVAGGRVLEGAEGPPVPEVHADRNVADVLGPFAEAEDADRIARDQQLADDRAVALRGDERLGLCRERTPGRADRGPASGRERGAWDGA